MDFSNIAFGICIGGRKTIKMDDVDQSVCTNYGGP